MFENKKIFILGFARSGYACAKLLLSKNNRVIINDNKLEELHDEEQVEELRKMGCEFYFGGHPDEIFTKDFDYLIKNPGIRNDHKYVMMAKEFGVKVINEVEMCYRLLRDDCTLIGITGTNGKTTTTTLTYTMLKEAFKERVHLVGNIGIPFSSMINDIKKDDIVVMEVSSQQSNNIVNFHPDIALLTNFYEAHIDFFGTYENYKHVKARMFYNQESTDLAIINCDNDDALEELKDIKSKKQFFSKDNAEAICHLEGDYIVYNKEKVIDIHDIYIPGMHNVENAMAAISIVKQLNVSNEVINNVLRTFTGVEHRLEFVREYKGTRFYNDTEATNTKCTQIALSSFTEPKVIILGGLERGQDFNDLASYMNNVKAIIAIGSCRQRVVDFANKYNIKVYVHEFLKDSMDDIKNVIEPGDVVLLSPASASWDQYKECEERGKEFKDLVNKF